MPKSRNRRKPKKSTKSTRRPSAGAYEAHVATVAAADRAEARGDAAAALALIEQDVTRHGADENFWRPWRVSRLLQIELFGPWLPRWAHSRWILDQAAQWLDPMGSGRALEALAIAEVAGGMRELLDGLAPIDVQLKLIDHDWLFRQAFLYDLGGLRQFLARGASADLVAGADRIHEWAATGMGAFRLLHEEGATSTWLDLASGEELGAAVHVDEGDHVVGRAVPIDGGTMFDSAPLPVPYDVAVRVAEAPGQWIAAMTDGCETSRSSGEEVMTYYDTFALLSDVPLLTRQICAVSVAEERKGARGDSSPIEPDPVQLGLQVFRAALDGRLPTHPIWRRPFPIVGATLLQPSVFLGVVRALVPDDLPKLHSLADRLPEPSAGVCRDLALASERAA